MTIKTGGKIFEWVRQNTWSEYVQSRKENKSWSMKLKKITVQLNKNKNKNAGIEMDTTLPKIEKFQ